MGEMMERYLTWPLLVGVALLINACVVTSEQFQALQHDVRSLRGDVNALGQGGVIGGEGGQEGEGGTFRQTGAVARLEELATETRILQGQLEENSYRLSEISQRLDETEMKVARLLGEPGRPGRSATAGQVPVPSPPVPGGLPQASSPGQTFPPGVSPVPPSGAGQPLPPRGGGLSSPQSPRVAIPRQPVMQGSLPSPEKVYKDSLTDYTKGNYDLAISGFKNYLTFFPKTSLVPNAQYWLAESYYSQRKYLAAIREFDKLVKDYPGSTKVPSAMLKQAYAYLELPGETAQGQRVLRELMAKFPRSREARLAQDRLERL